MIGAINNEALGLVAIHIVLSLKQRLNIANSYLIAPLIFDKKIRGYLKRKNTNVLSAQEFITVKSEFFVGFCDKYTDSLVATTNAIAMGVELKLFDIKGGELIILEPFSFGQERLGRKIDEVRSASGNIVVMLSEEPESLYSLLRVKV
ncbi:three component ABC system middle component [Microbulbifer sp. VAAF005]|uniref:three component ABC system middle component n=1 Tax=Microbulbifer sp. VAAF005 TaxID=3034230 RepID=UPI0024ACFB25|nr:three component ABC system middle component [Microbulbifer sp. VAAF005]WHI46954.1 DUF6521 family protein [Microbulbifer sp. VAAF005]